MGVFQMVTNLSTPQSSFLPEKLTGPQLVKKSAHYAEPEGSLLHSMSPPPFSILCKINPVHTFPSHF